MADALEAHGILDARCASGMVRRQAPRLRKVSRCVRVLVKALYASVWRRNSYVQLRSTMPMDIRRVWPSAADAFGRANLYAVVGRGSRDLGQLVGCSLFCCRVCIVIHGHGPSPEMGQSPRRVRDLVW